MVMFRLIITITLLFLTLFNYPVKAQQALTDNIFHPDSIKRIVSFLASEQLKGRLTGSNEAVIAAEFISNEFQRANILPVVGMEGYFSKFNFLDNKNPLSEGINVIGALEGKSKKEELIIFCAHYDHIGTLSTNPQSIPETSEKDAWDTIFNGANDNASGTAAMIILARYFGSLQNNERTILFIAFSGEEFTLLGSSEISLRIESSSIIAVINIEMIGRGSLHKKDNPYITGSEFSNLSTLLNNRIKDLPIDPGGKKIIFKKDPYHKENLFERSDNYPFALKGIPAHTLMLTAPDDLYYHSVNDETSTLNFRNMSLIIKAIALSTTGLVSGTDTPTRIAKRKQLH